MRFARIFLLLAAFQMEVRVRAVPVSEPLWNPAGCLARTADCHAEVGSKRLRIGDENAHFDAAAGTLLERKSSQWKILKGTARVRKTMTATVHGSLDAGEGEAWIIADGERVTVRAVEGPARFAARDGRVLEIPEGFEIWIGGLGSNGRNSHGVPEMVPVEDHLRRLSAMDSLDAEKARALVKSLRERWRNRPELAAAIYEQVSQRNLASEQSARDEVLRRQRARHQAREEQRRLLHRTAFEK